MFTQVPKTIVRRPRRDQILGDGVGSDPLRDALARRRGGPGRSVVALVDTTLHVDVLRDCLVMLRGDLVVLLGDTEPLPGWARRYSKAASESADEDLDWFVRHGPVDLVIDLRDPKRETRRQRWARLFPHLRAHGSWVVPRQAPKGDLRRTERAWLTAFSEESGGAMRPANRSLDAEAIRSVSCVSIRAEVLVFEKLLTHVVKLRDDEIDTVLARRDPTIRVKVITSLPARVFRSTALVTSHEAAVPIADLETTIPVPRMSARHYRGPVAFSGQTLMFTRNSVLADSFRFYHALDEVRGVLANPNLHDFDARVARVHADKVPAETLEGDYFQLDPQSTGHFGHIMTELVGRLWAWDEAKARFPDLKILMWARKPPVGKAALGDAANTGLETRLMTAYGVAESDIVRIDRPVIVTSLVSATAMWHNWSPFFVHPAIGHVWRRLARNLTDPDAPRYDRIFVTRPVDHWRRRCENTAEVEAFFAAHGFTIVHPEEHTVGEQAAMFADAGTIAGFGGSGLFNLVYAQRVSTIIILNQEGYTARNEHLFTAVIGCAVHYFWSTATHRQPVDGWSLGAYQSEWTFDFARNERALGALLTSLGRA